MRTYPTYGVTCVGATRPAVWVVAREPIPPLASQMSFVGPLLGGFGLDQASRGL